MSQDLLEQLIREQAPVPRDDFVASLDRRVEHGFASATQADVERDPIWTWEPALFRMFGAMRARPVRFLAIAMLVALVGGGIFSTTQSTRLRGGAEGGGDSGSFAEGQQQGRDETLRADDYQSEPIVGDAPTDNAGAASGPGGGNSVTTVSGSITDYRRHILGSGLFLAVPPKEVPEVIADAVDIAEDLDGYPGSSSFDVEGDTATGSADVWVPTDQYAKAMARLSRLGDVERTTQASRDVTASRAGIVDQIEHDRQVLRDMNRGNTGNEPNPQREAIENQLQLREQRLANLDRRIDMTLINVKVRGVEPKPKVEPAPERWSIEWALETAGDIVHRMVAILIVAAGIFLLPGLVAIAVWALISARRRRLRDRALDDE